MNISTQIFNVYICNKNVYMRTNVVIDDRLMKKALKSSGLKTKKAVIEKGLKLVISLKEQAGIKSLRGKLSWEGNLDESREER